MDLKLFNSMNTFSFDELVLKVAGAFECKTFTELSKLILELIQEVLLARTFSGQTPCHECSDGKLALNGGYNRKIRISLGKFIMRFKRMKCGKYGATHVPLQKLIRFRCYLTKTDEQEKLLAEKVSETSYRRGLVRLSRNGEIALFCRTAKEWILNTDCEEIQVSSKVIGSCPFEIIADSTKSKRPRRNGKARREATSKRLSASPGRVMCSSWGLEPESLKADKQGVEKNEHQAAGWPNHSR